MADKTLKVEVQAKDNASATFAKVGNSAESMGQSMEKAGKSAGALDKAAASLKNMGSAATIAAGALAGMTAGAFAIKSIQAAANYDVVLQRLKTTIEASGQSWGQYAESLKQAEQAAADLGFGHVETASAITELTQLTGDAKTAIDDLGLAMDIARGRGISLSAAVGIVAAAEAGQYESLAQLGIILDSTASKQEALAALQAKFAGQSAAYATTAAGDYDKLQAKIQEFGLGLGDSAGHMAQFIALLPGLSVAASGAGAAIGALAGAGARLAPMLASPVGILAGLAAVALWFDQTHRPQWGTPNPMAQSAKEVEDALSSLSTRGSSDLAALAQHSSAVMEKMVGDQQRIGDLLHNIDTSTEATDPALLSAWNNEVSILLAKYEGLNELSPQLGANVTAILNDMGSGAQAAQADFSDLLDQFDRGAITPAQFAEGVQRIVINLSSYDAAAAKATASTEQFKQAMAGLNGVFADLPTALDDLRLSGKRDIAQQLDTLHTSIFEAFKPPTAELSPYWASAMQFLTEDQLATLDAAWQRTMQGMSSGALDNAAVMEEWNRILDSSLDPDTKLAALLALSQGLSAFYDSAKAMQQGQLDFLGDGSRILQWWREYDKAVIEGVRVGGAVNQSLLGARESFRGMVDWAGDIGQAGAALDQALRTFQEIDALGQRSSSAGSIAEQLVGKPGEWADIDDMLQAGTISLEKYNEAVTAGHAIQESDARVQSLLNQIRRDQLPLLAEQQQAYEDNLHYLAGLNAEEQRRALMLQDSSVQAQIATLYNTAYAASLGEIPEEVATEMILEAANADAGLKSLLLQLGLLRENADGTISVVFPDADATVSAINRVTIAVLAMQAAAEGKTTLDLAIEIYGEAEALDLLGMVKDEDGKYVKVTVAADTSGLDTAARDLKEVTLADGTVVTVKTDVDTSGWDKLTAAELSQKFDNDPVKLPVEGVLQPMDGVTPEQWNNMIGPFPEIEIPATVKPTVATDLSSLIPPDLLSPTGNVPSVKIPVTADTSAATSDISAVTASEIPAKTAVILGDNAGAMSAIDATNLREVSGKTLAIGGDNESAMSAISAVNNAAVNDKYMTIYATTVYSSIGTPGIGLQHGGIAGYAHGGIPVELAEAGAEVLHFASGGSVPIFDRGIYSVPPMTYVSPANTGTTTGRGGIVIDLSGSTFIGTSRAEMDRWAETSLVPNLRKVLQDERAGYPR